MPTNRVRRRRVHEAPISRVQWALLNDEPPPEDLDSYDEHIDEWCFWDDTVAKNWSRRPAAELWQEYGAPILERLIAENPGLRPTCWWRVDAPRAQPGDDICATGFHPGFAQPRRRLGGVGMPKFEVLAHVPRFWHGVPSDWLTKSEAELSRGLRAEILPPGLVTGPPWPRPDPNFPGIGLDPSDPPIFESEAA